MNDILTGVLGSIIATILIAIAVKWIWPDFQNKCLYRGVRVDGAWDIFEVRDSNDVKGGKLELKQRGSIIKGSSIRKVTREGKESERKFNYHGFIRNHQVTMIFEDSRGVGFDTGTYVFTVQNDAKTMVGMATFHGKKENRIVSESRTLIKVAS